MAAIFAQELLAVDLAGFGEAQELAFEPGEALVEQLELGDQLLDAVVVQPHLLDARDELLALLLVGLLRARVDLLAGGDASRAGVDCTLESFL